MPRWLFAALWLWIGLVSSWDLYLAVKYIKTPAAELNPAGRWLLTHHGVEGLVIFKMAGTVLVLGAMAVAFDWSPRAARLIAVALAAFQAGLLAFLYFA